MNLTPATTSRAMAQPEQGRAMPSCAAALLDERVAFFGAFTGWYDTTPAARVRF